MGYGGQSAYVGVCLALLTLRHSNITAKICLNNMVLYLVCISQTKTESLERMGDGREQARAKEHHVSKLSSDRTENLSRAAVSI